jgi:3-hydroxyacyl-CoA dehydrogenase
MSFQKIAVIGAGVMGRGIAAQIANAGIAVYLMDIVPDGASAPNVLAQSALDTMLKTNPSPFMVKKNAELITPLNLRDDAQKLGECDWIIEVVLEDVEIKHKLYDLIAKHRRAGSIVSSNTSTIPLEKLVEKQDHAFAEDFMITHFFNPPRFMRLLEIVVGAQTKQDHVQNITDFCDRMLGKNIVFCHDTPGFIANRLGVFWMTQGINIAVENELDITMADAVLSRPMGIPKTGIFGLIDLVGIDLMPHLSHSLVDLLDGNDAYRKIYKEHNFITEMIAAGYTGRKGKGGFYRLAASPEGGKEKQALNLTKDKFSEQSYSAASKPDLGFIKAAKGDLKTLLETDHPAALYAKKVMLHTWAYAATLAGEVADDITAIDDAMRYGYNWAKGPFEMMDEVGVIWVVDQLKQHDIDVPALLKTMSAETDARFYKSENGVRHFRALTGEYHTQKIPEGVLLLDHIRAQSAPLITNNSCHIWDLGDGVLCFEAITKMNTMDETIFQTLRDTADLIENSGGKYNALIAYNEGAAFSAGANLGLAMEMIKDGDFTTLTRFITAGQIMYMRLKYAAFPFVAAPSGLALGGGCEILLHADHVQAHAETYAGLVEVGVGLIPAWGGCKEMILRYQQSQRDKHQDFWFSPQNDPMGAVRKAFQLLGTATISSAGADAIAKGYFKPTDGITMNRDRLLFDAKQKAMEMAKDYTAPAPIDDIRLPGPAGKAALDQSVAADMAKSGKATPYDIVVASHLATVLSGGADADWTKTMSEQDLLDLEIEEFMKLLHNDGTHERITHMLSTGKPLRN